MGMEWETPLNILVVANHYCVASARYATDAFKRLGHSVRHVGPAMGRNIWGLTLPEQYVWEPDAADLFMHEWRDWPELVLVMDSDTAILDSGSWNKLYDCPVVIWGVDNHVRDYRRLHFDHYFLAHHGASVMQWSDTWSRLGNHATWVGKQYADMTHLPCCYDPTIFTPSTIPWAERAYDVAMIGVMYEQRQQAVQALRAAGLKVLAGTGLVYENMAAAYQNARISLCLSSNGDVGQRVFESAACGCVVISDECADFALLKPKGVIRVVEGEVTDAVRLLLDGTMRWDGTDETPETLIEKSLAWVKPHTWDARAQVIIDWVEARNERLV